MANLTLRLVKGSPLTYAEVDDNFTALNNATGQFKNVLINGNFDIWQRGTSFTGTIQYGADRWIHTHGDGASTTSRQAFTLGQTDVPNEPEFFWRHDRTSASTVVNGVITQRIESVRTFAGQTLTWSFWAKVGSGTKSLVPVARQQFGTGGSPSASNEEVATAITITTSWQKFSITFTLDSISGTTIGTDGNDSLDIFLREASGFSTFTLDFAQTQVELGPIATAFERRPLGTELALCQRYFEKSYSLDVTPGTVTPDGGVLVASHGSTTVPWAHPFSSAKRAIPTMTIYSTATGSSGNIRNLSAGADIGVNAVGDENSHSTGSLDLASAPSDGHLLFWQYTASAEL